MPSGEQHLSPELGHGEGRSPGITSLQNPARRPAWSSSLSRNGDLDDMRTSRTG